MNEHFGRHEWVLERLFICRIMMVLRRIRGSGLGLLLDRSRRFWAALNENSESRNLRWMSETRRLTQT